MKLCTDFDKMFHSSIFADDSAGALSREVDCAALALRILRVVFIRSAVVARSVRGRGTGRFFAPI